MNMNKRFNGLREVNDVVFLDRIFAGACELQGEVCIITYFSKKYLAENMGSLL